jgi:hypothetical protein
MAHATPFTAFPGGDLIADGLADMGLGIESASALLASADPDTAHGRYNALVRRLVSFERAVEEAFGP